MKAFKPSRKTLLIMLGALGVILIGYGVLQAIFGNILSESAGKNLSDIIIFAALGIFLWNRKLLKDEKMAAAERKKQEDEAAAGSADAANAVDATNDESGTDAPG
jgi:hypothetical protein